MKISRTFRLVSVLVAMVYTSGPAFAEGDAVAGKAVFEKNCQVCHEAEKMRNGAGPYLLGVVGRPAASTDFPRYSQALKDSGIVWDPENISAFISGPKAFVPGTRMFFTGLKTDEEIANVVAYLVEVSKAK